MSQRATVHRVGEGPGTWATQSLFEHLVTAGDTDGRLGVSMVTQPPGPARFLALTVPGGLMGQYDDVGVPAGELRLPGDDGLPMAEEIARWNEVGPRYGLEVVGPPLPE